MIGAGIVGASAAYHLAELGEPDVLVLDQGPLFETGGSTSHAPGLAFQTNGSRMMCRIAQESVALYATLELDGEPAWYGVGGIEVATSDARMRELKRRLGFARSYGLEGAELLTPAEAAAKVPLLDPSTILGAYHVPSDGIAKGVRIAAALAGKAEAKGVAFEGGVSGDRVRRPRRPRARCPDGSGRRRVRARAALRGDLGPDRSVRSRACRSRCVAVQHQLVWTDPIPELEGDTREVAHPILRHQDMAMYFRHRQDHYAVGNYKHEPIATPQSELRRPGEDPLMPSLMPFTPDDFDVAEAEAARLLPALKGGMRPADPERSINGMFSFTPDAGSIVGESAEVRGVWLCEAVWVTHAGGFGRHVAEWMVQGEPSIDMAEADANRFYPYMTDAAVRARTRQAAVPRGVRHHPPAPADGAPAQAPALAVLRAPGGARRRVRRRRGLGTSRVVRGQRLRSCPTDAPWLRRDEWAARFWSPIEGAEHLATRSSAALFDLTAFAKFDVEGPDALAYLERICANRIDRPVGTIVYTAMLTPIGRDPLRPHDRRARARSCSAWSPAAGAGSTTSPGCGARSATASASGSPSAQARCSRSACGVRTRARSSAGLTDADLGNEAFPYMTARYLNVGEVGPVWAQRISYAGELGWELYGQFAMGDRAWELLWGAGREHGLVAAGLGAFDTLRLEKGYRLWGQDIHTEHDPFEAGLGFAVKMDKGAFQGREALDRGARTRLGREARVRHPRRPARGRARARSRSDPTGGWSATRPPPATATRSGAASSTVTCPPSWRCRARRSRSSTSTSVSRRRSPRTRCGTRRAND